MDQTAADQLPAATRIRHAPNPETTASIWVAGGSADPARWMHEAGSRTVNDNTVQHWLDNGQAEVLT